MAFDMVMLALLVTPEARALAAAWTVLSKDDRAAKGGDATWAALAGVPTSVARRTGAALIRAGICLPGGMLPEEVRRFIAAAATSEVVSQKARGRARKGPR